MRSVIGDFSKPRQEAHDASAQSARASQCTYHRRASRVAGVLDVLVRRGEETEIHPDQISAHEASMRTYVGQDYSLERIPNLGTSAGWDPKLNQLTVFDRSDLLILTLPPDISGDKAKEAAVQLAKEALAKLR